MYTLTKTVTRTKTYTTVAKNSAMDVSTSLLRVPRQASSLWTLTLYLTYLSRMMTA